MKTRLLPLMLILIFVIQLVPSIAQDNTLIMWSRYDLADTANPSAATLAGQIESFQEQTGIEVIHEQVAWDQIASKLAIAVTSGGDVPDIVMSGSQYIPFLLDAGALLPMDDILAPYDWVAELSDGDRQSCVLDDVRYCVAHHVRGGITYYRADAFENEFPTTTDEWLAIAPEHSDDDVYFSTQYAGRSYAAIENMWYPMIVSNSGAIFDEEGKPAWATPQVAEVVDFGRTLFENGYFPEIDVTGDFTDAEVPWIEGQAASFRGASWSAMFVPGLWDAVNSGDVLMTGGVDFGGGAYVTMVSDGWVIPAGAQNSQATGQWLDSFFEPEFLAQWAMVQFGIPTLPEAYEITAFDSPFYQSAERILAEQGIYMQQSPYYIESLDILAVAFQEMLLNPEIDALQHLEEAAQEVLNRYW